MLLLLNCTAQPELWFMFEKFLDSTWLIWFNLPHPTEYLRNCLAIPSSPSEVCAWDINWFCYYVVPQLSFCVTNCVLIQPSSTPSSPLTVCDIVWPFDPSTQKFGVDTVFLCLLHNAEITEVARSCVLLNSFLFPSPSH